MISVHIFMEIIFCIALYIFWYNVAFICIIKFNVCVCLSIGCDEDAKHRVDLFEKSDKERFPKKFLRRQIQLHQLL